MPKNYINQAERETIGLTKVMLSRCEELMEISKGYMSVDERKYLKSSITFYDKYIVALMKRVGPEIGKKIINDFKGAELRYTRQDKKDTLQLEVDAVEALAESILEGSCKGCPGKKNCHIKDILTACSVPPFDEDGVCQYSY